MSQTADELTSAISAKGEEIRALKASNPPSSKEALAPLVAQLNALKLSFMEVTGNDFDPPKPEALKKEKKVAQQQQPAVEREGPSKKELNKLARKEGRKAVGDKAAAGKPEGAADKPPKVRHHTVASNNSNNNYNNHSHYILSTTNRIRIYISSASCRRQRAR